MANKKEASKDTVTKKKNSSKTTTKKSTTAKSTTKNSATKKTITKKSTTKSVPKKNTVKTEVVEKNELEKVIEQAAKKNEIDEILGKGLVNNASEEEKKIETKQEKIEKEVIDEIKSIKVAKVENAKYVVKKKDKTLLAIGVLISLLGIVALILSLIANRLIDREFISDSAVTLMICASIIIEGFGAFIIINES